MRPRERKAPTMPFDTLAEPLETDGIAARLMEKFVIQGGQPLAGTIVPAGNKNAALPALAACLLTEEEVVLRNIPRIRDVEAMLELLSALGVAVDWRDENVVASARRTWTARMSTPRWPTASARRSSS